MSINTLLQALDPLPPGALVPVDWIKAHLGPADVEERPEDAAGLTVEQVGQELGRSPSTVRGWLISGELRGFKLGREWRVRRADLVAYLDAQASDNGSTKEPALGHSGRDRIGSYRKILNQERNP